MANTIKGTERKFSLVITEEGFSMDRDDFDVEISSPKKSIVGEKRGSVTNTNERYIAGSNEVSICREPNDEQAGTTGGWFVVADTQYLNKGLITVTVTAYVTDAAANDGVRKSLARATLDNLID